MTRKISLLALGAFALLPFTLQTASAGYYDRDSRLERDIDHDRAAIHNERAERGYFARREENAERHGHWLAADWFRWRKHQEDREIAARERDLHRDVERYRGY